MHFPIMRFDIFYVSYFEDKLSAISEVHFDCILESLFEPMQWMLLSGARILSIISSTSLTVLFGIIHVNTTDIS